VKDDLTARSLKYNDQNWKPDGLDEKVKSKIYYAKSWNNKIVKPECRKQQIIGRNSEFVWL